MEINSLLKRKNTMPDEMDVPESTISDEEIENAGKAPINTKREGQIDPKISETANALAKMPSVSETMKKHGNQQAVDVDAYDEPLDTSRTRTSRPSLEEWFQETIHLVERKCGRKKKAPYKRMYKEGLSPQEACNAALGGKSSKRKKRRVSGTSKLESL